MALQVETLFRHDARGRMTTINESNGASGPRIFIGRTSEGNVVRFRDDMPDDLVDTLRRLVVNAPPLREPLQPLGALDRVRAALRAQSPVQREWVGPAWWVPENVTNTSGVDTVILRDPAALMLHFSGWAADLSTVAPCAAVLERGQAVAVCCSVRTSPHACEAGVETLASHRGRGLAGAVVAAWASEVRRTGRLPLYSTSWDNVASQAVARRLGLRFYGVDLHLT